MASGSIAFAKRSMKEERERILEIRHKHDKSIGMGIRFLANQ